MNGKTVGYLVGAAISGMVGTYLADRWGIGWMKGYLLEIVGFIELTLLFAVVDALRKSNEQD